MLCLTITRQYVQESQARFGLSIKSWVSILPPVDLDDFTLERRIWRHIKLHFQFS